MKLRWPFRSRDELTGDPDLGDGHEEVSRARARDRDDDLLVDDDEPPKRARGRTRQAFLLAGLLVLVALAAWWRWPSPPTVKPGPTSDPLLAVRPITPPTQASPETRSAPEGQPAAPPERPPRHEDPALPSRSTYFTPLPPRAEFQTDSPSGPQQQLAALGWQLAVEERKTRVVGLETSNKELQAKAKEAEAKIAEAEARIQALKRHPDLILRSLTGGLHVPTGVPGPRPFAIPPPPLGFPQGSGPLVVPPKHAETKPIPPERTPKDSEIFVRMIDASGKAPEAMVSVGLASYVVRAGDAIGSWEVTSIGPNGMWIHAGPERAWRPLLARGALRADQSSGPPGIPAVPVPIPASKGPEERSSR